MVGGIFDINPRYDRSVGAIILSIGMVLAAEAVNSSIERLADFVTEEQRDAIKQTKDLAAGSVLILAIAAAAVGLIIFIPKLF